MSYNNNNVMIGSEICDYYKNKSIFITGATGFVGRVLVEKLLRSCKDLKAIYVLIRHKKGVKPSDRLKDLYDCQLFETLRKINPNFHEKLIAVEGDLLEDNLGISNENEQLIINNVEIIIHAAATVRFDEPLKLAVEMNVLGVEKVIKLSKSLKNLEVFVHISTAYANCDRKQVNEIVYEQPINAEKLIEAVNSKEKETINNLSEKVLHLRPNTYTYTKAVAENIVMNVEKEIPSIIVRPSIIISTWREPFAGWIDNVNGPTGLFIAIGKGILRSMIGNVDCLSDLVPVDTFVNLIIAAGWHKGTQKNDKKTIVVNYTSGQVNPITWGGLQRYALIELRRNPLENIIFYPKKFFTLSKATKTFRTFFEQTIPSYAIDFYLRLTKKKPFCVNIQKKLKKGVDSLEYFTARQWSFTNDNYLMIKSRMNGIDKKEFNFDIRDLNWHNYIGESCSGAKRHILKEGLQNKNKEETTTKKVKRNKNVMKAVALLVIFQIGQYKFLI